MTRRAVILAAMVSAALAAIPGLWAPWWVVLVAEVLVAALASWWTYARHAVAVSAELDALRRATALSEGLLLWEVRQHDDGRWSLEWARGAALLAWRPTAYYAPTPDETGPYTYWLDTWTDPSGQRDASVAAALDSGTPQRWMAHAGGRSYDTEAMRSSPSTVMCVTHDVTGAERAGAARGRDELVSLALDLDAMREIHHA